MRLLNVGCGGALHPDWTNLDTAPVSPEVIAHDLRLRFPFANGTFDAVYGSHVLEHFEQDAAEKLLQDCFRIMRPGGIIRVVVPDLEAIIRLYVAALEAALSGDAEAEMRYDWLMLELYDQTVRKVSGGNMAAYLAEDVGRKRTHFVSERVGYEGAQSMANQGPGFSTTSRAFRRLRSMANSIRRTAAIASAFVFLGPRGAAALRVGLFREAGEVHLWMYDRFSMARALSRAGFTSIQRRNAGESEIPGFIGYQLEIVDGRERKPDSLYMEARKPDIA